MDGDEELAADAAHLGLVGVALRRHWDALYGGQGAVGSHDGGYVGMVAAVADDGAEVAGVVGDGISEVGGEDIDHVDRTAVVVHAVETAIPPACGEEDVVAQLVDKAELAETVARDVTVDRHVSDADKAHAAVAGDIIAADGKSCYDFA